MKKPDEIIIELEEALLCVKDVKGFERRLVVEKLEKVMRMHTDASLEKKAFWRGFELARCFPKRHDILTFWNEYQDHIKGEKKS